MSNCGRECHTIGGPWIAEDPNCPVHGTDGSEGQIEKLEAERDAAIVRVAAVEATASRLLGALEDCEPHPAYVERLIIEATAKLKSDWRIK